MSPASTPAPFSLHSQDNLELDLPSTPKVDKLYQRYRANLQTLASSKKAAQRLYDSISAELEKNKVKYESDLAGDTSSVLTQIHPSKLEKVNEAIDEFNEERKACVKNIKALIDLCSDEDEDGDPRTVDKCTTRLKEIGDIAADLNSKLEAVVSELLRSAAAVCTEKATARCHTG